MPKNVKNSIRKSKPRKNGHTSDTDNSDNSASESDTQQNNQVSAVKNITKPPPKKKRITVQFSSDDEDQQPDVSRPIEKSTITTPPSKKSNVISDSEESEAEEQVYVLKPDREFYRVTNDDIKNAKKREVNEEHIEVSLIGAIRPLPIFAAQYCQVEILKAGKRHVYIRPMNELGDLKFKVTKAKTQMYTDIVIKQRSVHVSGLRMPLKIYKCGEVWESVKAKTYGKKGITHDLTDPFETEVENTDDENRFQFIPKENKTKIAISSEKESWLIGVAILNWLPSSNHSLFHDGHIQFNPNSKKLDVPAKMGNWLSLKTLGETRMNDLSFMWTYKDEWDHHEKTKVVNGKVVAERVVAGRCDGFEEWPSPYLIVTHPGFDEMMPSIVTDEGFKLAIEVADAPTEPVAMPAIAGILVPGEDGKIMSLTDYELHLQSEYWDCTERSRRQRVFPPVARGSPAEIFASCTLKPKKDYRKLSATDSDIYQQLAKESRAILNDATNLYNKVMIDQMALFLKWRNEESANGKLIRLTDEEIAAIRRDFNARTDVEADLANFAAWCGCLETLSPEAPEIVTTDHPACNGNKNQKGDENGNKPQKCDYCAKIFASVGSLNRHLFEVHEETKTKKSEAKRIRKCRDVLVMCKTKVNGRTKKFRNTCKYENKNLQRLKRHISRVHNWELKKCRMKLENGSVCGEYFTSIYKRLRHQEESAAHNKEKNFKCKDCGKTFARKDSKNRHERNKACKTVTSSPASSDESDDSSTDSQASSVKNDEEVNELNKSIGEMAVNEELVDEPNESRDSAIGASFNDGNLISAQVEVSNAVAENRIVSSEPRDEPEILPETVPDELNASGNMVEDPTNVSDTQPEKAGHQNEEVSHETTIENTETPMDHSAEKQNEVEKNADSLIQAAPVNGNNKTQNTTKTRDPKSKNEQEVFRGVPVTNNDIKFPETVKPVETAATMGETLIGLREQLRTVPETNELKSLKSNNKENNSDDEWEDENV